MPWFGDSRSRGWVAVGGRLKGPWGLRSWDLFQQREEIWALPPLFHELKPPSKSIDPAPGASVGVPAKVIGKSVVIDEVHMGWILKGFTAGKGGGLGIKQPPWFKNSVNFRHELDKWESS